MCQSLDLGLHLPVLSVSLCRVGSLRLVEVRFLRSVVYQIASLFRVCPLVGFFYAWWRLVLLGISPPTQCAVFVACAFCCFEQA